MKKNDTILLSLIACALFSACNNTTIVDEKRNFNDNTWLRFEAEEYTLNITDVNAYYNTIATLCYDTSYITERSLPLVVDFYSDTNELHNFTTQIKLRDKNGRLRGQTIGQYCTVSDTIDHYRLYSREATYTYKIKQGTSRYALRGLSSIEVQIEKSKIKL